MKKNRSLKGIFLLLLLVAVAGIFLFGQGNAQERTYRIGETGPAGGIIFYDKGSRSDGWQYLEAAPADLGLFGWGCRTDAISDAYETDPGKGKYNTNLIARECGEAKIAAKAAAAYRGGNRNDWYLPSIGELELMYKNLRKAGLGNFVDKYYWSSTQKTIKDARTFCFKVGAATALSDTDKANPNVVRPVRSF